MQYDVIIVGGGIIAAALAESLALAGASVLVLEAQNAGAGVSAAGMGHLVVLDDNPAELALARDGLERWQRRRAVLPAGAEYRECGTLWLARDGEELAEAERKQARNRTLGLDCKLLGRAALYAAEPNLAPGFAGGLLRPDEAVLYPPAACSWLLANAQALGARLLEHCPVAELAEGGVRCADGREFRARAVVLAAGTASPELLPGLPLKPRKGQLAITERYPDLVRHQLVELGYIKRAHAATGDSVAFNVQPRATGQILIGSSRENEDTGAELNWPLLGEMLELAGSMLPALRQCRILRAWTGLRPATPDGLPLLGPVPGRTGLWLATGHEGLGITTALSSAALLAAQILGRKPELDPAPYWPQRFHQLSGSALHA
ncbi:MAG: FAD-binding oxidoreductase [Gammaproteobacteria bacterium]|nr:FAD-binding oxidoreductase [Gammaproteobacteria bacterium]